MSNQSDSAPVLLRVENISKSFGETQVLKGLSFEVKEGEFLTILGSSGCGKTTLLRIISGLEEADGGKLVLDGEDVTSLVPNKRAVNTVFQSYALFPHMNIYDNIAYPLRIARIPRAEIRARVEEALALVQMQGYGRRYPSELSGGQRQRIAIARAVVARPKMLLLDEPLGALDLNLRHAMQSELKKLQKTLGITFLYITHDQEEALNMSDRIAVMRDGAFVQVGTPDEIYGAPKTVYVARFLGEANILPCIYESASGGTCRVRFGDGVLDVRCDGEAHRAGDSVCVAVRGETLTVSTAVQEGFAATVTGLNFAGGVMRITLAIGKTSLVAVRYGLDRSITLGQRVFVQIPPCAGILTADDAANGGAL